MLGGDRGHVRTHRACARAPRSPRSPRRRPRRRRRSSPQRDFRLPSGLDGDDRGAVGVGVGSRSSSAASTFATTVSQKPAGASRRGSPRTASRATRDLVELGAQLGRRREPRFDLHPLVDGELAVEIPREEVVVVGSVPERQSRVVGHGPTTPPAVNEARSMRRPRWMRDRTVPIGTPVDVGDLLVGEVAHVAQHDRHPELLGQRARARAGSRRTARCAPRRPRARAGSTRPGSSGSASVGRRFRRRISSRNTFVTIRANQPSRDPGS